MPENRRSLAEVLKAARAEARDRLWEQLREEGYAPEDVIHLHKDDNRYKVRTADGCTFEELIEDLVGGVIAAYEEEGKPPFDKP